VVAGLNTAVTPVGTPVALSKTLAANPFCPLTPIVLLALPAWTTLRLAGEALRVKLGATTVRAMVAVLLRLPEVPAIVTV
jgi:hypothetical protein